MVINKIKIPNTNVAIEVNDARIPALTNNSGKVLAVNSSATGLEWVTAKEPVLLKTESKPDQEFVYRACPQTIGADAFTLNKIYGKTLVWNQIFTITSNSGTQTSNGVTISCDGNELVLSGTASAETTFVNYFRHDFELAGRKYIVRQEAARFGIDLRENYYGDGVQLSKLDDIQTGVAHQAQQYITVVVPANVAFGDSTRIKIDVFDLTLMFGSGYEPSTVEEFEALFPGYHSYEPGKLISNDAESIETVGFNQWDEEWELGRIASDGSLVSSDTEIRSKNFCPIVGGCDVCFRVPVLGSVFYFYDADFNFVDYWGGGTPTRVVSIPSNCAYFKISMGGNYGTTYNNDICINLSDQAKNGTYEPYRKSVMQLNLGSFQVRDGQGNVTTITGGLKSAGDARDEIVGNKYIKRFERKVLDGTEGWYDYDGNAALIIDWDISFNDGYVVDAISNRLYNGYEEHDTSKTDGSFVMYSVGSTKWLTICLGKNATELKQYLAELHNAGTPIIIDYVATPIEYTLVSPLVPTVKAGTTEARISPNADGLSAPMVADMTYGVNAGDLASDIIAVDSKVNAKQDTLISGTNIKTINSQSILGSGNISISVSPDIASQQEIDSLFVGQIPSDS